MKFIRGGLVTLLGAVIVAISVVYGMFGVSLVVGGIGVLIGIIVWLYGVSQIDKTILSDRQKAQPRKEHTGQAGLGFISTFSLFPVLPWYF